MKILLLILLLARCSSANRVTDDDGKGSYCVLDSSDEERCYENYIIIKGY